MAPTPPRRFSTYSTLASNRFSLIPPPVRWGLAAVLLCLTTGLSAQLVGPPQNVRVDAYDRGLVVYFDPVDTGFEGPRISKYQFIRDGRDPVDTFFPIVDSPLEPSTTYEYQIFGTDNLGNRLTETATISATTRPAGEGITTTRLSQTTEGIEGTRHSETPVVSADGRYVAFITKAPEFLDGSSIYDQVVLLDRNTGQFQAISRNAVDEFGNDHSASPAISANGRYVTFITDARNLAAVETIQGGVFLFDAQTGSLTLVSKATDGEGPDRGCVDAAISDDGATVAFVTNATNLIAGSTDDRTHAYVADLDSGAISRITGDGVSGSVSHDEFLKAWEVGLNGDGSLVTYRGGFKNNFAGQPFLSGHWLYDRSTGETTILTAQATGLSLGLPAKGSSLGVADLTPDGRPW